MDYLVDTCFLIDLWREQRKPGPATALSRKLFAANLGINWVTAGEFLGGGVLAGHEPDALQGILARYRRVQSDDETVAAYARLYAQCRQERRAIGPADLWIAASALRHAVPLITRNQREFAGLPGLESVGYP